MQPWYPLRPPVLGLVHPVPPGGDDGPTPEESRGPKWRSSSWGLHVPADVDVTIEQRIVEAGARLPAAGMVTGWAALRLFGAAFFEGRCRDVPVLLPHASRIRAAGVEVRRTRLALPQSEVRYGVRCAPPAVALVHELRRERDLRELVVMIEMALLAGIVTREAVRDALESTRRMHTRHFDALDVATGQCRSPAEVRMMLTWLYDARLPTPLMNREVLDLGGRRRAVVDLLAARKRARRLPEAERPWRVGAHVPMRELMRPLTWEERAVLDGPPEDDDWGTESG